MNQDKFRRTQDWPLEPNSSKNEKTAAERLHIPLAPRCAARCCVVSLMSPLPRPSCCAAAATPLRAFFRENRRQSAQDRTPGATAKRSSEPVSRSEKKIETFWARDDSPDCRAALVAARPSILKPRARQ